MFVQSVAPTLNEALFPMATAALTGWFVILGVCVTLSAEKATRAPSRSVPTLS